jgi:hypothetical protein
MTPQRLNLALAAIFLIVGILATTNTFRLNSYIRETVPRDQAQEECQSQTLDVLRGWVAGRYKRDVTVDARDDATIVVLDKVAAGQTPTPEEFAAWRDAVSADNAERLRGTDLYHELPDCQP